MIKRNSDAPRKRYGPGKRKLVFAAVKGAGMGALLTLVLVKLAA